MPEIPPTPVRSGEDRFGFGACALHVWAVIALAVSNAAMILSIAAVPFAFRGRFGAEAARLRRYSSLLVPLAFYVLACLLSVAFSLDPGWSLVGVRDLLGLATVLLVLIWVRDAERLHQVVDGVVVMAALSALWGLGQFLTGYGDLGQRIRGPFSHYMTFAGVLLMANLLLLARFACHRPRLRDWRWVACAFITAALLGSLTRSSWVALALTLFVLVLLRRPKSPMVWLPVAALAVALLVAPFRQRVVSIVDLQDPSNYDRLSMLDAGLEMVSERPFFGLGPGMPERLYPIYRPLAAPRKSVPHLHNTYLQIAAEGGLFGLGAYSWLIAASLLASYRGYRCHARGAFEQAQPRAEELFLGSLLAVVGFSLAGLFEANWLDTEVQRVALFLLAVPFLLEGGRSAKRPGVGQ